jgi:hypothetical protein
VVLTTRCGQFGVDPDGHVRFLGARRLPVPRGSSWFMGLTWYRVEHGHLLVGRGHRLLWRSHGRFAPAYGVGSVALSGSGLTGYALDGSRRFHLYGDDPISSAQPLGSRMLVGSAASNRIFPGGKEGVNGSSPLEGSAKAPHVGATASSRSENREAVRV